MIAALLVLSVIILFHEFGHFLLARLNGVTVVEFSMGFGPRLLTHVSKKSGTRYSWKLFPLGGSCMMYGEDEELEAENGAPAEGSFNSKTPLQRISVIAAGPIFNFIMAFVFASIIVSWAGIDPSQIKGITEGSPAESAGLMAGDRITRLNGRTIHLSREITTYFLVNGGRPVDVSYERYSEAAGTWEEGMVSLVPQYSQERGAYMMGVKLGGIRPAAGGILEILQYGAYEVRYWIYAVIDSLKLMVTGNVSTDDIAGPVRMVAIIDDTVQETKVYGFVTMMMNLLNLSVLFSANLGVMNLLPLPALDGGRLVFLAWELVTRKPVDQRVEGAVHLAGLALLMTLMVFVVFNDLRNLF